jgi:hypothetical protein
MMRAQMYTRLCSAGSETDACPTLLLEPRGKFPPFLDDARFHFRIELGMILKWKGTNLGASIQRLRRSKRVALSLPW